MKSVKLSQFAYQKLKSLTDQEHSTMSEVVEKLLTTSSTVLPRNAVESGGNGGQKGDTTTCGGTVEEELFAEVEAYLDGVFEEIKGELAGRISKLEQNLDFCPRCGNVLHMHQSLSSSHLECWRCGYYIAVEDPKAWHEQEGKVWTSRQELLEDQPGDDK